LNERQQKALLQLNVAGQLTSAEYQQLTGTSRQTATRDLYDLVKKKVIVSRGRGRGAHYVTARRMPQK
jgi:ATP-dependent DNA helicase RecG